MGLDTDFNQAPYYDDFDAEKNFHRVLFKPGLAVQARELTQLQTILQNQIERFGNNVLREGTIIEGCNFVEVPDLKYVKIADLNTSGQPVVMSSYVGARAVGLTSGVEAKVELVSTGLQSQTPNLNTLHVKYLKTGNSEKKVFDPSENIEIRNFSTGTVITTVQAAGAVGEASPVGNSYGVRVGDGIIYQKGHFVRVEAQFIVISKYNNIPDDLVIGFRTSETIVTSNNDTTLLDNANGYNNYNAPGADRLKLTAVLFSQTVEAAKADDTFFAIQEYDRGNVVRRNKTTQYGTLQTILEQRTAEESGNYTVKNFPLFTSVHPSNTELVSVGVGAGIAYVEGKRVELTDTYYLDLEKASTTAVEAGQSISTNIGHYVRLKEYWGSFDPNIAAEVSLRDGALGAATATGVSVGATNEIGTARIRAVTLESGTPSSNTAIYRAYIFDIQMDSGKRFSDVASIYYNGAVDAAGDLVDTRIIDGAFKRTYFPIGREGIASVPASGTTLDYVYRTKQSGLTIIQNANTMSITLTSGAWPYSGTLNSDQKNEIILISQTNQSPYTVGKPIDLSSVTVTVAGSSLNFSGLPIPAGGNVGITAHYNVKKTASQPAGKDLVTAYFKLDLSTHSAGVNGPWSLGVPDVHEILNVYVGTTFSESNPDKKAFFVLDNGQKDAFYGLASIKKKKGITLTTSNRIIVKARVFKKNTSSSDGFFTVNSYPVDDVNTANTAAIQTAQIPFYTAEDGTIVNLRDVVDLRPYVANTAAYATSLATSNTNPASTISFGTSELFIPAPNKEFETDYQYYLARRDLLTIDKTGEFVIVSGDPAESPIPPSAPATGMVLATINIPVYPSLPKLVADKLRRPDLGITLLKKEQRRYTMKDIGDIESRVSRIEYYTALNALESKTRDQLITDASGNTRFKNGILTDNFEDLSGANLLDINYAAGIDPAFKEITPKFQAYHMDLMPANTGAWSNITDHGDIVTLANTSTVEFITQRFASQQRNCVTDFYKFSGNMSISPTYDSGYSTTQAPAVNFEIDLATPFIEFTEALANFVPLSSTAVDVVTETVRVGRTRGFFGLFRRNINQTTTTTTTTTSTLDVTAGNQTTEQVGNFVTDVRFSPFMRSRPIVSRITGLRPNTTHYPFFDGISVAAHCAPLNLAINYLTSGGQVTVPDNLIASDRLGANLVSDSNGVLMFVFWIPEETFHVGDRALEVVDVDSMNSISAATSYAKTIYHAFNYSVESTALNVTTRMPDINIDVEVDVTTNTTTSRRRRSDPIAQTFGIDPNLTGDSVVMLSELDIFFARKSSNVGVTVEIRETENGFPGSKVLPFGKSYKAAADVNVSADASLATTFTFDSPIPLRAGAEYCFVIKPDANDPDYLIWIGKTGGTDVLTGEKVVSDSHDGVLFTSTNDRAWTPYQDEDIKFVMRSPKYAASGSMYLTNSDTEFLLANTIVGGNFRVGEKAFVVNANTNGTIAITAGNTTITGTGLDIFNAGEQIAVYANTTVIDVLNVVTAVNSTVITVESAPISSNNSTKFFKTVSGRVAMFDRNDPAKLYLDLSTAKSGTYTYTNYASGSTTAANYFVANTTIRGEFTGVTATIEEVSNFNASYIQPNIYNTNYTFTDVKMYANTLVSQATGTNYVTSATGVPIKFNDNTYLNKTATIIKSRSNEIVDGTGKSFVVKLNLSNSQTGTIRDASPMIDYGISNITAYEYLINNVVNDGDTTELQGGIQGPATSKFVTKTVTLAEGFDAEDLKVFMTAYRPPGTTIKAYARFQNSTDPRSFDDIEWTELSLKDTTNLTSSSADRYDYREFEFSVPELAAASFTNGGGAALNTDNSNILRYKDATGTIYDGYKFFAIKIALLSTTHKDVPRLSDLRAIALT